VFGDVLDQVGDDRPDALVGGDGRRVRHVGGDQHVEGVVGEFGGVRRDRREVDPL
jgi:hypothetical protein